MNSKFSLSLGIMLLLLALVYFGLGRMGIRYVEAASAPCPNIVAQVSNGLISATSVLNFSNDTRQCVLDNVQAPISALKINKSDVSDYKNMWTRFYYGAVNGAFIQKNAAGVNGTEASFNLTGNGVADLYYFTGNVSIGGNLSNNGNNDQIAIIFIYGNLNITAPTFNDSANPINDKQSVVFIVQGDIYISPATTRVDAVLVSNGNIYTAGAGASCSSSSVFASALTVNGSLISLYPTVLSPNPQIVLCRTLVNNTSPAEVINFQAKYLAILKDVLAEPITSVSETEK